MPYPPVDGGSQLMHFTSKGLLANDVKLKTLAVNPTRKFININSLPSDYISSSKFEQVKIDTRIKPVNIITNLFKKESYFTERFNSNEFTYRLRAILEQDNYEIIQLEHLYLCKYLPVMRKYSKAKIVLRPQNVEYIIWQRYLQGISNPVKKVLITLAAKRLRSFEENIISQLDAVIALTEEDAQIFRIFSKNKPVHVISMGYDFGNLKNYDYEKQFENLNSVYHLASMDWLPNIEAVEWFFLNVLPLLRKDDINAKLYFAGNNMPQRFYKYQSPNVVLNGSINDSLSFQEDKPIMIVPLHTGSGIRAKIIEGLALGKTIISTSIGAQGIAYVDGKNILIADTPEDFTNKIGFCIRNPEYCRVISNNARKLGNDSYHYINTAKQMINIFNQILN